MSSLSKTERLREHFFTAVVRSDVTAVAKVIAAYPDAIHWKNTWHYAATPLMLARSAPEVAVLLLEKGADVNARDEDGDTPLIWAADANAVHVIRLLLKHGADALAVSDAGRVAAAAGSKEAAALLREAQERQAAARDEERRKENLTILRRGLPRGFKIPTPLE